MTKEEAASSAKALYLQAAALAGKEVASESPERLAVIVGEAFEKMHGDESRRREAVGNLLKLLAAVIVSPMEPDDMYHEKNVDEGQDKTCPVYPFDKK
jgi:hypothetical protein